jgi:uncharacterized membrane protein YkvA (DUF1232 family)
MNLFFRKLRTTGSRFKREIEVYQLVRRDKRTPKMAKVLLALAVGYALLPFDIIPDFIPVVGHLDDFIIIPALLWLARKVIPNEVMADCQEQVRRRLAENTLTGKGVIG